MSGYDPTNNDQPAPKGLFGLASPGKVIAIGVVVALFGTLFGVAMTRHLIYGHF